MFISIPMADKRQSKKIGFDEYIDGDGVCLIEWSNLIEEILPDHMTSVTIEKDLQKGFDYRKITVEEI